MMILDSESSKAESSVIRETLSNALYWTLTSSSSTVPNATCENFDMQKTLSSFPSLLEKPLCINSEEILLPSVSLENTALKRQEPNCFLPADVLCVTLRKAYLVLFLMTRVKTIQSRFLNYTC